MMVSFYIFRKKHGVLDLTLSEELTEHAQEWANEIAARGMLIHSSGKLTNGSKVGENIYMSWPNSAHISFIGNIYIFYSLFYYFQSNYS